MNSKFVVSELVVRCFQLVTHHGICCQYYQSLSFLIRKHLIIFVTEIIERMWSKTACDFFFFSYFFVASAKLRIQTSRFELCFQ